MKIEDYISGLENKKFEKFINLIRKYEEANGKETITLSNEEKLYSRKLLNSGSNKGYSKKYKITQVM